VIVCIQCSTVVVGGVIVCIQCNTVVVGVVRLNPNLDDQLASSVRSHCWLGHLT